MRYLSKISMLVAVLMLVTNTVSADKYTDAWKKVDELVKKDLPQSAAGEIGLIRDMALEEGNSRQLLKCAVRLSKVETAYDEGSLEKAACRFNALLPELKEKEYQAICHAFLAKGYLRFLNGNDPDRPAKETCDTVLYHLGRSVELAGGASSDLYEEFYQGSSSDGLKLRPTLADMLMEDAIMFVTGPALPLGKQAFLQDVRLYGTASDFQAATAGLDGRDPDFWALYVLRLLTAGNSDSKALIRCSIDLKRMEILREYLDADGGWNKADDAWVQGCVALGKSYSRADGYSTMFNFMASERILNNKSVFSWEQRKDYLALAHSLCVSAEKQWPKSEGACRCKDIRESIERMSVSLSQSLDLKTGQSNVTGVTYRNVSTIFMKLVEVEGTLDNRSQHDQLEALNKADVIHEWTVSVADPKDWLDHYALLDIPPVREGRYYLVASTGAYFTADDVVSYQYMECASLGFVGTSNYNSVQGTAVSVITGKPVPDCGYVLWYLSWDGSRSRVARRGKADSDGFISIDNLEDNRFSLELESGSMRGHYEFSAYYYWNDRPRVVGNFYTDRNVYMPGDSVFFTFVGYTSDRYENGHAVSDARTTVSITDSNGKEIEKFTLVTDSMGIARGSLRIPEKALPGRYSADCVTNWNGLNDSHWGSFTVESFKQPKFEIKIDEIGQKFEFGTPITVTGRAVTYTGVPVTDADVSWKVDAGGSFHRLSVLDKGRLLMGSGETKTGPDGTFSFTYTATRDMLMSENFTENISVTVTDLNGESHEAGKRVYHGRRSGMIYVERISSTDTESAFRVSLRDADAFLSGDVRIKVSRVEWADEPLLPLPFTVPSDSVLKDEMMRYADEHHFARRFPQYEFNPYTRMEPVRVLSDMTVNAHGDCDLTLPITESGYYRVEAVADGYEGFCSDFLIVLPSDCGYVPDGLWGRTEQESDYETDVELGDTARIRLSGGKPGTVMYWFVESRLGLCMHGKLEMTDNQQLLEIPVTGALKGRFSVHVGMMHDGMAESRSFMFRTVDPTKRLIVRLDGVSHVMEPDSEEEWTVMVTDCDGSPVQAALVLDLYDSALDKYGRNWKNPDPWNSLSMGTKEVARLQQHWSTQYTPYGYYNPGRKTYGKNPLPGELQDPFIYYPMYKVRSYSHTIDMNEFEGLGITTVDEAMQGRIAGLDIVFNSGDLGARSTMHLRGVSTASQTGRVAYGVQKTAALPIPLRESDALPASQRDEEPLDEALPPLRTDMNPTALFVGGIMTDENGRATVRFKAPQLLTRWNLQGFAYSEPMQTCIVQDTMVTRKTIMVEPSAPRFLRQGDVLDFTQKVSNLSEGEMKASVSLTLTDGISGRKLKIIEGAQKKDVTIPAGGSVRVSFHISVPKDINALTYTTVARTSDHSDAIQQTLPVLTTRMKVVQSLSLFNNGREKREFNFRELKKRTDTMSDEQLILEYSASPIWYAVQSLPAMVNDLDISTIGLLHKVMGTAITMDIVRRNPAVSRMLEEWRQLEPEEWEKRMELNRSLTETLSEETPWLLDGGTARLRNLARVLDPVSVENELKMAENLLLGAQLSDGGFPWIVGFPYSSVYVTEEIVHAMGQLMENGAIDRPGLKSAMERAVHYLDSEYYKNYYEKEKPEKLSMDVLDYLLVRSYFSNVSFNGSTRDSYGWFMKLAGKQDTHNVGLYYRTELALLFARDGQRAEAERIAATLLDRSLYDDEMGRYWRDNVGGYLWYEYPIETQSLIIRTLLSVGKSDEAAECARWLLKQKQTTDWGTGPATASAVVALMAAGGNRLLEQTPDITIRVGRNSVKASDSKATAGYTTRTWKPVTDDMAKVVVESKSDGISWGAVYRSFTEEMANVEHSGTGMTLQRSMWLVRADSLEQVRENTVLHVGDRVKIRFRLTTDRTLEYLQLSDMRPATFEPVSTRAGYHYNWGDDIAYYVAPGGTRNVFYIDRLSKGSYMIEYDVYVEKPGRFLAAPAVMQCLYAPQFRATTESSTVTVGQ